VGPQIMRFQRAGLLAGLRAMLHAMSGDGR
jgi:hypothetical protein